MSVPHLLAAAAAGLPGSFGIAAPEAAHDVVQAAGVGAYTLTAARFWATSAALLGLAGAVVGAVALSRAIRRIGNSGRRGAVAALASGLIAVVGGALNLAVADGGPGTGNGVIGGALAVLVGLMAMVLGGLVLARARHTATPSDRPTGANPSAGR